MVNPRTPTCRSGPAGAAAPSAGEGAGAETGAVVGARASGCCGVSHPCVRPWERRSRRSVSLMHCRDRYGRRQRAALGKGQRGPAGLVSPLALGSP